MNWTFEFTAKVVQQYKGLEPELRRRVKEKLLFWESQSDPLSFSRATPSFKAATHRFRIGKYRIIVKAEREKKILTVVKIGPRDKVYKDLM